jgi:hypothetical protein
MTIEQIIFLQNTIIIFLLTIILLRQMWPWIQGHSRKLKRAQGDTRDSVSESSNRTLDRALDQSLVGLTKVEKKDDEEKGGSA